MGQQHQPLRWAFSVRRHRFGPRRHYLCRRAPPPFIIVFLQIRDLFLSLRVGRGVGQSWFPGYHDIPFREAPGRRALGLFRSSARRMANPMLCGACHSRPWRSGLRASPMPHHWPNKVPTWLMSRGGIRSQDVINRFRDEMGRAGGSPCTAHDIDGRSAIIINGLFSASFKQTHTVHARSSREILFPSVAGMGTKAYVSSSSHRLPSS